MTLVDTHNLTARASPVAGLGMLRAVRRYRIAVVEEDRDCFALGCNYVVDDEISLESRQGAVEEGEVADVSPALGNLVASPRWALELALEVVEAEPALVW